VRVDHRERARLGGLDPAAVDVELESVCMGGLRSGRARFSARRKNDRLVLGVGGDAFGPSSRRSRLLESAERPRKSSSIGELIGTVPVRSRVAIAAPRSGSRVQTEPESP